MRTAIEDVLIFEPTRHGDERGFFSEVFNLYAFRRAGLPESIEFVQDNHSLSAEQGTVRGLHYQAPPHAQNKLVRVAHGAILDVVVDVRKGSPTYGEHVRVELSRDNWRQVLVPAGFLHGFVTLAPNTEVLYKVDAYFSRECDGSVRWNDPALGIDWGVDADQAVISRKDREAPSFADFDSPFAYDR
nr:dTDP-4-dehydrorhamnose 3,5-epimerase [Marinicauda algicola]